MSPPAFRPPPRHGWPRLWQGDWQSPAKLRGLGASPAPCFQTFLVPQCVAGGLSLILVAFLRKCVEIFSDSAQS